MKKAKNEKPKQESLGDNKGKGKICTCKPWGTDNTYPDVARDIKVSKQI